MEGKDEAWISIDVRSVGLLWSVRVLIDENADPAVVNVATNFVEDLYRVSGRKSNLLTHPPKGQEAIILIGDVEHSPLLKSLVDQGKLDVEPLLGQWEAFQVTTVPV